MAENKVSINYEEKLDSDKVDRAETLESIFSKSDGKVVTLSIHNKLGAVLATDDTPPMHEMAGWSRFEAYIIKDGVQVRANIPAAEVSYILDQSRKADWLASMSSASAEEIPSCYKVTLMSKLFKDKTPAEVLLEDPKNKDELTKQYIFLRDNVAKFPKNKAQMDAITEAMNLFNAGKLKPMKSPVSDIYVEDIKYLKSKTDKEGRVLVYSIAIRYTAGQNSPVSIEIGNCYAKLKESNGGQLLPDMKNSVSAVKAVIRCPYKEWFCLIDAMNEQVKNFKTINFKKTMDKTDELVKKRNLSFQRTA